MKFRKAKYIQGPGITAHNTEFMFSVVNEGKRKGFFQYVAHIDFVERIIDGDLPLAGRNLYKFGFTTQREARTFLEAFAASEHYSYDQRKQDAFNAVQDAEAKRILGL